MLCKKQCPVCKASIPKRDVFNTGNKRGCEIITCNYCNSKLEANWGKVGGWMALFILPAGPLFNIFNTSSTLGIVIAITVTALILLPLSLLVGVCKVPLIANDKNT